MLLAELVATSRMVAESGGKLQKIEHLAALLKRTPAAELEMAIAFLSGIPRQGRIGMSGGALREARDVPPVTSPALELSEVNVRFEEISRASGPGSAAAKAELLRDLFRRATAEEQNFLGRLLFGELRQGALEGVLVEAVARAAAIPSARIRRAAMLEGALAPVARRAIVEGASALEAMVVRPLTPVRPMLAGSAANVGDALGELEEAAFEYKLDGARIQVHKSGDEVRVYSRALRDITVAVPEVVERAQAIGRREVILDGEALVLRPDGTPQPFQVTMRRIGRKIDVPNIRETLPVVPFFFDCLYADGTSLIDEPLSRRAEVLAGLVPREIVVPRIVTAGSDAADSFLRQAVAAGHEGVVAKAIGATYLSGRRGGAWLKVKQARTLDLVVLAVEWGSGRRRGMLSNLHLGARDEDRGGFVMLGKTFKGLTDEMLSWQTKKLLELEVARDLYTVYVRPQLVVEIAFNEIQASSQYPGRLALRFARIKRYRTDKPPAEADTLRTVQKIYAETTGLAPPVG